MHFIKTALKQMLFVRMPGKYAFPQLEVCSAEHPLSLFACFRNIFLVGISHLRTSLWLSSSHVFQSVNSIFPFLWGRKAGKSTPKSTSFFVLFPIWLLWTSWIPSCKEVTSKQFYFWVSSRVLFSPRECLLRKAEFCCTAIELQGTWLSCKSCYCDI